MDANWSRVEIGHHSRRKHFLMRKLRQILSLLQDRSMYQIYQIWYIVVTDRNQHDSQREFTFNIVFLRTCFRYSERWFVGANESLLGNHESWVITEIDIVRFIQAMIKFCFNAKKQTYSRWKNECLSDYVDSLLNSIAKVRSTLATWSGRSRNY
jgi:hypothetical protein